MSDLAMRITPWGGGYGATWYLVLMVSIRSLCQWSIIKAPTPQALNGTKHLVVCRYAPFGTVALLIEVCFWVQIHIPLL